MRKKKGSSAYEMPPLKFMNKMVFILQMFWDQKCIDQNRVVFFLFCCCCFFLGGGVKTGPIFVVLSLSFFFIKTILLYFFNVVFWEEACPSIEPAFPPTRGFCKNKGDKKGRQFRNMQNKRGNNQ